MRQLRKRPLSVDKILTWAAVHRERMGKWPTKDSGAVIGERDEDWPAIDHALREGLRGLPGGSSLARLLAKARGVRNIHDLPPLNISQIGQWMDEYRAKNGTWPTTKSGKIPNSGGETWLGIDSALRNGIRGLPAGSSLARFREQYRGVRNRKRAPHFHIPQILEWMDLDRQQTGNWPRAESRTIDESPDDTWLAVDMALRKGLRGLPGGSSLAQLLADHRGVVHAANRPDLSVDEIKAWARRVKAQTGKWPNLDSGPIAGTADSWRSVHNALKKGKRGLPGGSSLAEFLNAELGRPTKLTLPTLTRKQIIQWARLEYRRTGVWPTGDSGKVADAPGETWPRIDEALRHGWRGLPGGSSLADLLAPFSKKRNPKNLPRLSYKKILRWADHHRQETGKWPNVNSGQVLAAPEEQWDLIDNALRQGGRGLPGDSSLLRLLVRKRHIRDPLNLPPLDESEIVDWAKRLARRHGRLPNYKSGKVEDAPDETWSAIDSSLRYGKRGLPGGSSLAKLLKSVAGDG